VSETRVSGADLLTAVLDHLDEAVYLVDTDRRITLWNKAAEAITGWASAEVVGRRCADGILRHCNEEGSILCGAGCPLLAAMDDGESRNAQVFMLRRDGARIPVHVRVAAMKNSTGSIDGCIEVFSSDASRDAVIDEIRELRDQAMMDALTGLPNRRFLLSRLTRILDSASRNSEPVAVLFIDLDHFKGINDGFGHEIGDEALRVIGATLRGNLRAGDLVARWGGEEFLILAPGLSGEALFTFAERIRALVERCEIGRPKHVSVTASIGCTTARLGETWSGLVARADALMYESKKKGRNRVTQG
jgi:diguanylate cyclase (GGDEF)-like protein/PAS domain S-box-containing protein